MLDVPTALVQPLVGHFAAQRVAELQPAKLAAFEGHYKTGPRAPLAIGGWPDHDARMLRGALEIPGGLSFLAFNSLDAEVKGLEEFPRADWPHPIVHFAFDLMVGLGSLLAGTAAFAGLAAWRARERLFSTPALTWFVVCAPLGFVATEAGWVVTEVGRQPWIVYGLVRTHETITTAPNLGVPFALFVSAYAVLGVATAALLATYFKQSAAHE